MILRRIAASAPGIRRLRRPEAADSPAFDLAYVRTGPVSATPVVVIPGGPGLASILPYRTLRRWAARGGLDLIMIEHRGVGLSRTDVRGRDLPASALRITAVLDDIAAVLDDAGVDRAYVAGSSYGSYLTSAFGARHPDRVAGMVLDSALQSTADLELERQMIRELFWHVDSPMAANVRRLASGGIDHRRLLDVVRAAYELGGRALTAPLLDHRARRGAGLAWRALEVYAARDDSIARFSCFYEFDLAGVIGFRELNYAPAPDGGPLDPALTYAAIADRFPAFSGEPYDLPTVTPTFEWPMVLLVGSRDIRTPPPIAQRVAATARDAVLVPIDNGHSALDTHPAALLNVIRRLVQGRQHELPAEAAAIDRLPRRGLAARLPQLLSAAVRIESALSR